MIKRTLLLFLAITISACALPVMQDGPEDRRNVPSTPDDTDAAPSATTALLEQSRTQSAAGQYPQAAASIERALRIEPGNPYLWLELARVHMATGNDRQAEAHARKALTLAGDDTVARRAAQRVLEQLTDR